VRQSIAGGRIVGVKGLGGFHLACDAANDDAVRVLRERKGRGDKPFAVMFADLPAVEGQAQAGPDEGNVAAAATGRSSSYAGRNRCWRLPGARPVDGWRVAAHTAPPSASRAPTVFLGPGRDRESQR
jgi:hypothetical protein